MNQSIPLPGSGAHAALGHFDELRGRCVQAGAEVPDGLAPNWERFFQAMAPLSADDLERRGQTIDRMIRDNGVTYNVYADADGPQRPWSLDLFPMIIDAQDWAAIEAGICQRAQLLEALMADVYGSQELIAKALLPQALVQGHPGYLHAMQAVRPVGGLHLRIAAFDLARSPQGQWWVVSQRTQAPSGLGYLLENRSIVSRQFPQALQALQVRSLEAAYQGLLQAMHQACPAPPLGPRRIVLLTPGPYNETYFEHAYLARHLGLTLVEGGDLTVREERLFLKTIDGLEPVHGVLKRLDDEFLDPLELRADSTLGVPGLLQVVRAGHVLMANAPGSAFLESPALLGFLPALSEHLLGQRLQLPSLATWWCGEQAAAHDVLPHLREHVIKPTYPSGHGLSSIGHALTDDELAQWSRAILERGEQYTVQAYLPLSQTPTWRDGKMLSRSALIRVFALADAQGRWRVLPGALGRVAKRDENIASMQQGGSSADVWVLGQGSASGATADLGYKRLAPPAVTGALGQASVSSRAGENLFWLGRYTQRAKNRIKLARLILASAPQSEPGHMPMLTWLGRIALDNGLLHPAAAGPALQSLQALQAALLESLADAQAGASLACSLHGLKNAASQVRERLSPAQWQTIVRADQDLQARGRQLAALAGQAQAGLMPDRISPALRALDAAGDWLTTITQAQNEAMRRDEGWHLLCIGRHIEQLGTLAAALTSGLRAGSLHKPQGLRAMQDFFDDGVGAPRGHAPGPNRSDRLALLVHDADNPHSLRRLTHALAEQLRQLKATEDLSALLPDPAQWTLATPGLPDPAFDEPGLLETVLPLARAVWSLSDLISRRCFTHATEGRALGT